MTALTAWDYNCIAEAAKAAERIAKMIDGKADTDMVRSPLGDSRPEPVSRHKELLAANHAMIARIMGKI